MKVSPAAAALVFVSLCVLAAGLWGWIVAAARAALTWGWIPRSWEASVEAALAARGVRPRLPLLAFRPRRPVPWSLVDLLTVLAVYVFASLAVATALHQLGWIQPGDVEELSLAERQAITGGNVVISLLILGIALPLVAVRCQATLRDFGWSPADFATDVRLGVIAFTMLGPPVYALQGLLVKFWQPSKHPLIEMFKGAPNSAFFVIVFVSAAIVAPLFEELLFRVLLQGFLEKAFNHRGPLRELVYGGSSPARDDDFGTDDFGTDDFSIAQSPAAAEPWGGPGDGGGNAPVSNDGPYASPAHAPSRSQSHACPAEAAPVQRELGGPRAWLPIAISSSVFALLHYSHGPDWIPLALLAAGLGYLYQRTHRLVPIVTVHATLNAVSLWGLWVSVEA